MYRKDIDGLRAIAVLPVLFFHYEWSLFSGGFIGVDIFFVVSGYLITNIIAQEIANNKFTIPNFYERRIRRIFPALFTVLFVSAMIAYFILLPQELKDFGQSMLATSLFSSNFLFWLEAGYFDVESLAKPLLHTWSLSIEEQYYLIFPLVLIFSYKYFKKYLLGILSFLWLASFLWSCWSVKNDSAAAFFLMPVRAWELMMGSILALLKLKPLKNKLVNECLGLLGLAAIAYAIIFYSALTPFPGLAALLPCLGTVMVIYSGNSDTSWARKVLSIRPLVLVGLISYSLYLWHWPLYVFARLYLDAPPSTIQLSYIFCTSLIFAWASWKYIEQPFRGKKPVFVRQQLFYSSALISVGFIGLGLYLHIKEGLPNRLPPSAQQAYEMVSTYHDHLSGDCLFGELPKELEKIEMCTFKQLAKSESPAIAIWGDSHAGAIFPGFLDQKAGDEMQVKFIGMTGCPPLVEASISNSSRKRDERCKLFNQEAISRILNDAVIDTVLLSAYWPMYVNGDRLETDPNQGNVFLFDTNRNEPLMIERNASVLQRKMQKTIELIQGEGKKVILVGPSPELQINGAFSITRRKMLGMTEDIAMPRASIDNRISASVELIETMVNKFSLQAIFPHTILCDQNVCPVEEDGLPLYHDRHHISPYGAKKLTRSLKPI